MSPKPLAGIRVLEVGHIIAGPFAGTLLGYFGAEVIKIEPPGGDQLRDYRVIDPNTNTSYWWASLGRNKHSLCLDLHTPQAQTLVQELAASSDVLIENFKPGKMESWNLGPADLAPHLIYARISGYGQTGPYSSKPGFASVCESVGGFRHVNGIPGGPSIRPNLSLGDTLAGLHATLGILTALLGQQSTLTHRNRAGQVVDVAIYEAVYNVLEGIVPEYDQTGIIREPSGSTVTGIVPSNTYACGDGKAVVIGANTDSLFVRLMETCGHPEVGQDAAYDTNAKRVIHQEKIDNWIGSWCSTKSAAEVVDQLEKAKIPVGKIYNVEDMMQDPHFQARGMFERTKYGDGSIQVPAICPKLEKTPGGTKWAGQRLGEDSRYVLETILSKSAKEIDELVSAKVVYE